MRRVIAAWLSDCDPEIRTMAQRQFSSRAKSFRPVTVFACYHAMTDRPLSARVLRAAAAVELLHNVSLIVDDILDRSRYRRGELSLHCRYGFLPGLMTAGYIGFAAPQLVASDPYSVRLLAELMQRLGAAECFQWRVRRQPMGVEDWRAIAGADTGSMFEICARLGTRDDRLQRFGLLLGMLYHGCDDVGRRAWHDGPRRRQREGHRRRHPDPAGGHRDPRSSHRGAVPERVRARTSSG